MHGLGICSLPPSPRPVGSPGLLWRRRLSLGRAAAGSSPESRRPAGPLGSLASAFLVVSPEKQNQREMQRHRCSFAVRNWLVGLWGLTSPEIGSWQTEHSQLVWFQAKGQRVREPGGAAISVGVRGRKEPDARTRSGSGKRSCPLTRRRFSSLCPSRAVA